MVKNMNIEKLTKSLEEQEQNLKNFLECTMEKQRFIISNDIDGLQKILMIESQLLISMEDQSKKISDIIEELKKEHSLDLEENTVSEFINAVKFKADTNIKVVHLLQDSIKDLIFKASGISYQNKILIEHSRSFIRETINSLVALNNNQLLDRRV